MPYPTPENVTEDGWNQWVDYILKRREFFAQCEEMYKNNPERVRVLLCEKFKKEMTPGDLQELMDSIYKALDFIENEQL